MSSSLAHLLPSVHDCLRQSVPEYWPGLRHLLERYLAVGRPEVLLPLAACQAAGADPTTAVPVAAAAIAAELGLLILDDVYDQDRPDALFREVGPMRAHNLAAVFHALAMRVLTQGPWPPAVVQRITAVFCDGLIEVGAGQDRDLAGQARDLDACWAVAERKTGGAYAGVMHAGALCATDEQAIWGPLRAFGYHVGLAVQVFNDLRGTWFPDGVSDLARGKVGLPLAYALTVDHPDRALLLGMVRDGQVARHHVMIRDILDRLDTRAFLVWAALQHRDRALAELGRVPPGPGSAFLVDFLTGFFGNIDDLLAGSGELRDAMPEVAAAKAVVSRPAPRPEPESIPETRVYRSLALSLRNQLREGRSAGGAR